MSRVRTSPLWLAFPSLFSLSVGFSHDFGSLFCYILRVASLLCAHAKSIKSESEEQKGLRILFCSFLINIMVTF